MINFLQSGLNSNWYGSGGDQDTENTPENTTADGKQIFMLIGDSKGRGTSLAAGPTPTLNTVYYHTGSNLVAVTNADIENAAIGSPWPQFGIDYNAGTGYKPVFVNTAVGSTCFNHSTASLSWYTNGTLYPAAVSKMNSALTALGLVKPRGVFIILGINDYNGGTGDILTPANSLIDRLNTDFGTPPIFINMTGQINSSMSNQTAVTLKRRIRTLQTTYANVYVTFNETLAFNNGATYSSDGIHFTQTANNIIGSALARYVLSTETDKDVRRITTSNFMTALSASHVQAWKDFVTGQQALNNFSKICGLQVFRSTALVNARADMVGLTATLPRTVAATHVANNCLTTSSNGALDNVFAMGTNMVSPGSKDDFIVGVKVGTVSTAAGTLAALFGAATGPLLTRLFVKQTASNNILWAAGANGTFTYSGHTSIQANTEYAVQKISATSAALLVNGSSVNTGSPVADTPLEKDCATGGVAADPTPTTPSEPLNAQYQYWYWVQNTGFDLAGFRSGLSTLMTALATP